MKKVFVLAVLVALVAACAAVAHATPTFTGATGGIALPDAKVTSIGDFDLAVDYQRQDFYNADEATHARVTYGFAQGAELGFKYSWQAGKSHPDGLTYPGLNNWGASMKYVLPVKLMDMDVAVGGQYAKYEDLSTEQWQFYTVCGARVWESYDAVNTLDVNIGVNWIKFDMTGNDIDKFHAFTTLDYGFSRNTHIIGEYQTEADPDIDPLTSLALRYQMDENLSFQGGVTNAFRGVTGGGKHNWFLGVNYNFIRFSE